MDQDEGGMSGGGGGGGEQQVKNKTLGIKIRIFSMKAEEES